MTVHKSISLFIFSCFLVTMNSCDTKPKLKFSVLEIDSTRRPFKLSINDLSEKYKFYQGQNIETTGRFYQAFEEFAIYTNKSELTGKAKGFWLHTDYRLNIDQNSFEKMNGKIITIRGIVDTTRKGHLSSYLATIRNIYYWAGE